MPHLSQQGANFKKRIGNADFCRFCLYWQHSICTKKWAQC